MANNAMQVYEKLGLRKVIEENGNPFSSMNITKTNLSPLSKIDLSFFEEKYKVKNIAIHRGVLQQILIDKLNPSSLILKHKLKKIKAIVNGHNLDFYNREKVKSNTLIAADGLNSTVRQDLFVNQTIRNANQVCWRGVIEFTLPAKYQNELHEAWGKTERFDFVQIAKNKGVLVRIEIIYVKQGRV